MDVRKKAAFAAGLILCALLVGGVTTARAEEPDAPPAAPTSPQPTQPEETPVETTGDQNDNEK